MIFHWSLSDSKSLQVSSILVNLSNDIVWVVSTCPIISFRFILWSAGTAKSTILQILFFVDYYEVWSSGRD